MKRISLSIATLALSALALAGCTSADNANSNTTATTNVSPPTATPAQNLSTVERPQKIKDLMTGRGEQDQAKPTLKFLEPREGQTITGSTVNVRLDLGGDLKGYQPHKNPDGKGNHIHVILDNQPYEAYYELGQPFELRNVAEGKHTLRVFPSRPWHESYKNDGAFQMVTFTVKGGGDASKPTTTNSGQVMANGNANRNSNTAAANSNSAANSNATAAATPPREGKDMT